MIIETPDGHTLDMRLRELYAFLCIKYQRRRYRTLDDLYCPACREFGALKTEERDAEIDQFFCGLCKWSLRTERNGPIRIYEMNDEVEIEFVGDNEKLPEATVPQQGESIKGAVLTEDQVREMRQMYHLAGATIKDIAVLFGVSYGSVRNIVRWQSWKHVQ